MTYTTIDLAVADGVAAVRMNRPERLNAMTREMLEELCDCFEALQALDGIRVAVLGGNGRAFAAGVDLTELDVDHDTLAQGNVGPAMNEPARNLIALIEAAPFPVIARVHGACFTGALEIALACDFIVAADSTKFGDTHAKLGLRPTWGMTVRLREAVGLRRARELSYTSRTFSGTEAHAYGMVTRVVPLEGLDNAVADICDQIEQNSPNSLVAYKTLNREETAQDRDAALAIEGTSRFPCPDAPERVAGYLASLKRR